MAFKNKKRAKMAHIRFIYMSRNTYYFKLV